MDSGKDKSNKSNLKQRNVFWLDDITVLVRNNNYIKFIPTEDMTRIEQLNSITRFCLYLILILVMFERTDDWLTIPIVVIIFTIILHSVSQTDPNQKKKELFRMTGKDYGQKSDDRNVDLSHLDADEFDKYYMQTGYKDHNGKMKYGGYYGLKELTDEVETPVNYGDFEYNLDEIRMYQKSKCRKPTVENPFMNTTADDFNKPRIPKPCNIDDDDLVKEDVEQKFHQDLYRDIEDVFNRKNSQRQFFTIPHRLPNDQEAFGRWCYSFPPTCKESQERCLNYEDQRHDYIRV